MLRTPLQCLHCVLTGPTSMLSNHMLFGFDFHHCSESQEHLQMEKFNQKMNRKNKEMEPDNLS